MIRRAGAHSTGSGCEVAHLLGLLGAVLTAVVMAQDQPGTGYALALDRARQQGLWVTNFGRAAPTHEITVEFWQRVDAQANQGLFVLGSEAPPNCIGASGPSRIGAVYWHFGDWQGAGGLHYWPPQSLVNTWQHFAFVASHAGGYMKIFRNGLEEASKAEMTPFVRTNATLMIGTSPHPEGRWGGRIDEFRIWSVARTRAEIQADLWRELTGTESNLVAYWRFNEGAGTVVADATGHGHTGVLVNGPQWVESAVPPVPGAALSFNDAGRTNQHLVVPGGVWFDAEFTIEAWVYERSYQFSSCLLDFGNAAGGDNVVAFLSFESTGMPVLAGYKGEYGTPLQRSSVWSRKRIPLHTWTHVAFTRETNGLGHIYLDGAHVTAGVLYAPRPVWRTNNFIGRSHWPIRAGPDAILDEVRLWNVARSAEQIRRGMDRVLTGVEPNLVAYWRMDEGAGETVADATGHGHTAQLVNGLEWVPSSAPIDPRPAAHTLGFRAPGPRSVVVQGAVSPNGFPTTVWFEYGRDARYGSTTLPVVFSNRTLGATLSTSLLELMPDTAYCFRLVCTNVTGRTVGEDRVVRTPPIMFLGVPAVRWRFAGAMSGVVGLLVGAAVRYGYGRKFRLKLERLRQQQAVEQDRARIARDLHDDLGAAVTRIQLLGELVERDAAHPEPTARHGQQISQTSRELARHMEELVWVVNPQKDRLENLVNYLAAYAEELLGMTDIRCRLDFPEQPPDLPLSGQLRHRLFLAFKEALNNVVKHAHATEVHVRLCVTPEELLLSIADDGQGFEIGSPQSDTQGGPGGNGLPNLKARLAEIGGTCAIASRPGAGTTVTLRVKPS